MSIISNQPGKFTDGYKENVFLIWYNAGKPTHIYLYNMIDVDPATGDKPKQSTIREWILGEFAEKAKKLDDQVMESISEKMVAEKVEMLERHAKTGVKMQSMANEWLALHGSELTPGSAIRLLIEGIRIERDSRGLPDALTKMMEMTDEELLEEVKTIVAKAPSLIVSADDNK